MGFKVQQKVLTSITHKTMFFKVVTAKIKRRDVDAF